MASGPHKAARRLEGRVAVLSPHLDDAVLSLGGSLAAASRRGVDVRIVTVFGYDPNTRAPAGAWDTACGFHSAAEAARRRREEDARACAHLRATPVWLPFSDEEYADEVGNERLWREIADALGPAEIVLTPGFPLVIRDHERVTRLALAQLPRSVRTGLYVEQPYAAWRVMSLGGRVGGSDLSPRQGLANATRLALAPRRGRPLQRPELPGAIANLVAEPPAWEALRYGPQAWLAKQRAIRAHRSQVRAFGPLVLSRIALHERAWGGEGIAWVSRSGR